MQFAAFFAVDNGDMKDDDIWILKGPGLSLVNYVGGIPPQVPLVLFFCVLYEKEDGDGPWTVTVSGKPPIGEPIILDNTSDRVPNRSSSCGFVNFCFENEQARAGVYRFHASVEGFGASADWELRVQQGPPV